MLALNIILTIITSTYLFLNIKKSFKENFNNIEMKKNQNYGKLNPYFRNIFVGKNETSDIVKNGSFSTIYNTPFKK